MNAATIPADKAASKGFVLIGFILSTLLTGVVTLGVGVYNSAYQATRSERRAQVEKFVQPAQDFDLLVRKFVADEAAGGLSEKTRQAIRDNLHKQYSALESVRSNASASAISDIDKYRTLVVKADAAVKGAHNFQDSHNFAQAALDLGSDRESLLKKISNPPSLSLN